ncbi:universal stress protein [Asticcacaulis sp.]|uniref:universal stress protein n=1 Tax=Asticcacaulis sp. TaxID=1872648 RepID=UPI002B9CFD61|nr:universal stress protein [Asticcacaulis sp.]HTM82841.1 universal stress protein [Asticcacaulis sp.]
MSIKSILCVFSGERYDLNALSTAFTLAREGHARLRILHIAEPPILAAETLGIGGYGFATYGGATSVDILEKGARDLYSSAIELSREWAGKNAMTVIQEDEGAHPDASRTTVVFRARVGAPAECLNAEGRTVDLIIAGFDNSSDGDQETIRAALYKTARPLLLLPRLPGAVLSASGFPQTVVLAWDGSLSAARAMRDGLPFLLRAKDVYVFMAEEDGGYPAQSHEADLTSYLESHEVFAKCVHIPRDGEGVGARLLEKSSGLGAGLLIMGGYGRGHLEEAVLGGATRHVLQHSHLPLLLSH